MVGYGSGDAFDELYAEIRQLKAERDELKKIIQQIFKICINYKLGPDDIE